MNGGGYIPTKLYSYKIPGMLNLVLREYSVKS